MHAAVTTTLVAVLLFALVRPMSAAAADPWLGTWTLDADRSSKRAEPSPYKRVTIRIEPDGEDRLTVQYDMVGTRGGVTHREWTGGFDGRHYPVHGVDYVLTNAYRRLGPNQYEILVKVDGVAAARAVATVSADGSALTVVTSERDAQGREVESTAVYRRVVRRRGRRVRSRRKSSRPTH